MSASPFRLAWFSNYGARNWDLPDAENVDWRRPARYLEAARLLEQRGGFEAIILADGAGINDTYKGTIDAHVKWGLESIEHDVVPMLAAMSQATRHLGLVGTLSTSVYPPYLLARLTASFDHLTGGRMGWNVVTSTYDAIARNFGADTLPPHDERYDRADEYMELVTRLWESWEPDAVLEDRAGGRFADAAKVHAADYAGTYHRARGPLTVPRPPQRRPVIVQAGGSPRGRDFAAKQADIILSIRNTPAAMKDFRDDIRERARAQGRDPDAVKVFFTIPVYVGETAAEARAFREYMVSRPTINDEVGLANYSSRAGFDFSTLPLDQPLESDLKVGGSLSMVPQYTEDGQALTLREIALSEAMKDSFSLEGSPREVAEAMIDLMAEVGGDGIAIRSTPLPTFVGAVVDRVVPILRERGVVRQRYRHRTFRENLHDPAFAS
jgi:FMN-dependent oxidoreductase (nitrilotriacetate monooxygenase family)